MTDPRIVTVGAPQTIRHQIANVLSRDPESIDWVPTVSAVEGSIGSAAPPALVVCAPSVKELDAFGLAQFCRKNLPATAVLLVRERALNGTLPAAMRAGIRDVVDLTKGTDDLQEALESALAWSESLLSMGKNTAEVETRRAKLISVFSSKGGTGKTFLTTNLSVAIALETKQDVAVVDLDLDLGDVFTNFGKEPGRPLADLLNLASEATREEVLETGTLLADHLWGFGSPYDPSHAGLNGEAMGKVIQLLKRMFDYVVIDATADYSDAALVAFDLSDQVFLISGLDIVGVRHLSLALQTLLSLGYPRDRFKVVVNRADSKVALTPDDVERVSKVKVDATVPSSRLVPLSLNKGQPVTLAEPKSDVARAVHSLVQKLVLPQIAPEQKRRRSRKTGE
jgi:pilus assembly protein CpaE